MSHSLNMRLESAPKRSKKKPNCVTVIGWVKAVTSEGFVKGPDRRVVSFAYGKLGNAIIEKKIAKGTLVKVALRKREKNVYFCNGLSLPVI